MGRPPNHTIERKRGWVKNVIQQVSVAGHGTL